MSKRKADALSFKQTPLTKRQAHDVGHGGVALSPLPVDVLLHVADHVPRRTLVDMLRVNSMFYSVAVRLLYRSLVLGRSRWPDLKPRPAKIPGPFGKRVASKAATASPRLAAPKLNKIRTVDVHAHSLGACDSDRVLYGIGVSQQQLPPLPRLQTLRLWLTNTNNPRHFHMTGDPDEPTIGTSSEVPCLGLSLLRPSTLVLRNVPLLHAEFPREIVQDPVVLAAKHVIVVFTPTFEPDCTQPIDRCALDSMPASFATNCPVTIVFQTPNEHTKWRPNPVPPNRLGNNLSDGLASLYLPGENPDDDPYQPPLPNNDQIMSKGGGVQLQNSIAFLSISWLAEVFAWIARLVSRTPEADITLVNAESLDPLDDKVAEEMWPEGGFASVLPCIINHFHLVCALREGATQEEAASRLDRVHLVGMPEFLNTHGETVFPNNELPGWRS